jgi:hypothetical protein
MRRLLNEVALLLLVVAKVKFGDVNALASTFLIFREHKNSENVIFGRVLEAPEDFPIGIESEGRFVGICLIEAVGGNKNSP